jgi:hypothetical protein
MINDFIAGGVTFLVIFLLGAGIGAYLATPKQAEQKEPEPEFSHVEGGKRICQRV